MSLSSKVTRKNDSFPFRDKRWSFFKPSTQLMSLELNIGLMSKTLPILDQIHYKLRCSRSLGSRKMCTGLTRGVFSQFEDYRYNCSVSFIQKNTNKKEIRVPFTSPVSLFEFLVVLSSKEYKGKNFPVTLKCHRTLRVI